jgi:hypothetical protein
MSAFNEWVRGSFLEPPRNRGVVNVALNILYGAALLQRLHLLRCQGVPVPAEWVWVAPLEPAMLQARSRPAHPVG